MKFRCLLARLLCVPVAASLVLSGCSNLTPGENAAVAGVATGLAVGLPLALTGVNIPPSPSQSQPVPLWPQGVGLI